MGASAATAKDSVWFGQGGALGRLDSSRSSLAAATGPAPVSNPSQFLPRGAVFSSDGTSGFFPDRGDGSVGNSVVKLAEPSSQVSHAQSGSCAGASSVFICKPLDAAISPDDSEIWLVSSGNNPVEYSPLNRVAVLNASDGSFKQNLSLDDPWASAQSVAFTPDGDRALVGDAGTWASWLHVFSTQEKRQLSSIWLPSTPTAIAVTPDGKEAYVLSNKNLEVYVVDLVNNWLLAVLPIAARPEGARGISASPDGSSIYVAVNATGTSADRLVKLDTKSWAVTSYALPTGVTQIAAWPVVSGSGDTVYVLPEKGSRAFSFDVKTSSIKKIDGLQLANGGAPLPNQAPTARLRATVDGMTVKANSSGSYDIDGQVSHFKFDYGDGVTQETTSTAVTHTYATPGTYEVSVEVVDEDGLSTQSSYTGHQMLQAGSERARKAVSISALAPIVDPVRGSPPDATTTPAQPARSSRRIALRASAAARQSLRGGHGSVAFELGCPERTCDASVTGAVKPPRTGGPAPQYALVATLGLHLRAGEKRTVLVPISRRLRKQLVKQLIGRRTALFTIHVTARPPDNKSVVERKEINIRLAR